MHWKQPSLSACRPENINEQAVENNNPPPQGAGVFLRKPASGKASGQAGQSEPQPLSLPTVKILLTNS